MAPRLLPAAEYKRQNWRNGSGTTAEIWREPLPDGQWLWRLSMADVASDGPFSIFPGIDRHIMLIEGVGVVLDHSGGAVHRLDQLFVPHAFSGDVATHCQLISGACRDLNLMVQREGAQGGFRVFRLRAGDALTHDREMSSPADWPPSFIDRSAVALYVLTGKLTVADADATIAIVIVSPKPRNPGKSHDQHN